jgi:hypothetical protein
MDGPLLFSEGALFLEIGKRPRIARALSILVVS